MASGLDRAYDHCQRVAHARAKNFYYAFRMLPPPKRRAVYAIYAVCRLWDDIADDDMPLDRKRALFVETRRSLASALDGGVQADRQPEFVALADTSRRYAIPRRYFEAVLDGVESDLVTSRYANFHELRDYCRKVASAVGLICISIFGYDDPHAEDYAEDMGIALQLTNVLRDIREDAERDRIYIPQDELAEYGYGENGFGGKRHQRQIRGADGVPGGAGAILLRALPSAVRSGSPRNANMPAWAAHRLRRDT